ncbi:MAG: LPS O-antigen length regulator [Agarilytica sp.]
MTKDNIDVRLKTIEYKLDSLVEPSHSLSDGLFYSSPESDEIDLRELFKILWWRKWVIVVIVAVFTIASVFYALSLPNIYKSEALLAPSEESSGGGIAGMAGQLGGLANLAGVNFGGGGNDKTSLALEILKSREFATSFIRKHNLLVPLMAAEGWNREIGELVIDGDDYDVSKNKWVRDVSSPFQSKPSALEAYNRFSEILSVSQNKDSGLISLGLEFYSPVEAKQWVDWLVVDINATVKARDVEEAQRSIKYLTSQLEKTPIANMQSVFFELIEEQTKIIMFAEVRDEYVFKTLDKAVSAEIKTKPKRGVIVILGMILGGVLSMSSVIVWHFFKGGNS